MLRVPYPKIDFADRNQLGMSCDSRPGSGLRFLIREYNMGKSGFQTRYRVDAHVLDNKNLLSDSP